MQSGCARLYRNRADYVVRRQRVANSRGRSKTDIYKPCYVNYKVHRYPQSIHLANHDSAKTLFSCSRNNMRGDSYLNANNVQVQHSVIPTPVINVA